MKKSPLICAGIDTGKSKLDVGSMAMPGASKLTMIPTVMRFSLLGEAAHAAQRIGIEARGGHERTIVAKLRMEGFEVIAFQPKQVRAMFRLQTAKNNIIDGALIAACSAAVKPATLHRIRASPPSPSTSLLSNKSKRISRAARPAAKDIKLPNSRPRSKRKSRVQKAPQVRPQTPPRHPARPCRSRQPAAFQWNPALAALYGRLKIAGNPTNLPLSLAQESSSSSPTPC